MKLMNATTAACGDRRLVNKTLNHINKDLVATFPYTWNIWTKLNDVNKIDINAHVRRKWAQIIDLHLEDEDYGNVITHMAKLDTFFYTWI